MDKLKKKNGSTLLLVIISFLSLLNVLFLILNFNLIEGLVVLNIFDNFFYIDNLNLCFIFLNNIIFFLVFIYNWNVPVFAQRLHDNVLFFIFILLNYSFLTNNLLLFYISFEALLMPMYFLIIIWGSRGRRVHAAYQFFFFTFASSIFILIGLLHVYFCIGSLCFLDFKASTISDFDQTIILFLFFFGFMAKIPIIPFHIWLPEAHVEASTIGSVILAAILLKLGFYGICRTILTLCTFEVFNTYRPILMTFCIISFIYSGMVALRQVDLKKIIAYSSIVHMNFGLFGLLGNFLVGFVGSLFIMFCHGLISAGMFFLVGMLYNRFHVRNIMYFGGLVQYMPMFSIFFLFFFFSNMSFPGTCNFVGEFLVYLSFFKNSGYIILFGLFSIITTSIFCIVVVCKVVFYQLTCLLRHNLYDLLYYEFVILFFLSYFIILFGLFPDLLLVYIRGF